ncbi:MAG: ABC-2 type transport system permease protein [Oceanicoccus sp.]|jgi:ABC-2 type transport system permease protein
MNLSLYWVSLVTLVRKEVTRFLRIWAQTLLPPVINQTLYFVIFGSFIGSQVGDINGISYMAFLVPGLVMMSVISASFSNVVSSFFGNKFQRSIEELMVSPTPNWVVITGYASGGVLRGLIVGALVFLVSFFFVQPQIEHPLIIVLFVFLTSVVFSLGGLVNGIFAKKFDDISLFSTFILTPLTYFGGVFYSVEMLPEFWQGVSKFNPILYMIDGFRYGFYGQSDLNIWSSIGLLCAFTVILVTLSSYLLRKGIGMRD